MIDPDALRDFLRARFAEEEAEIAAGWDFASLDSSGWMGHAATWGRDRARAECEAKRELLALADPYDFVDDGGTGMSEHADKIHRLLALPYADHPDYREEWRP